MPADDFSLSACLERVRQNDQEAGRALVEYLYPLVLRIVRAHLPRRMDEEDLAQEVFLKMFTRLDQYRGQVPFDHWISRVAVTTCIDQLRFQQRRPELRWTDLSPAEASALESAMAQETNTEPAEAAASRELVAHLLQCLPPKDRLIIHMLDLEGASVEEIAQKTGWNRSLIKVRAFRARRKLKHHLERLMRTGGQL